MVVVRLAVDTTVPIYALGTESPHRSACRALLRAAADEQVRLEASVGIVQEVAHVRSRRTGNRAEATLQAQRLLVALTCHPIEQPDMERALTLFAGHPRLDMLDAVHAATALNHGISAIVTADKAFDDIEQLTRVAPADALELLSSDE